jgi:hypothetical protein
MLPMGFKISDGVESSAVGSLHEKVTSPIGVEISANVVDLLAMRMMARY